MKYTLAVELLRNGTLIKKSGTNLWIVSQPFTWYISYKDKTGEVTVSEGFEFDFGSIPRPLRPIFNPTEYLAYILHDYLYHLLRQRKDDEEQYNKNRDIADSIMYEALGVEGMNIVSRSIIRKVVSMFGGIYQKHLRKKEGFI